MTLNSTEECLNLLLLSLLQVSSHQAHLSHKRNLSMINQQVTTNKALDYAVVRYHGKTISIQKKLLH